MREFYAGWTLTSGAASARLSGDLVLTASQRVCSEAKYAESRSRTSGIGRRYEVKWTIAAPSGRACHKRHLARLTLRTFLLLFHLVCRPCLGSSIPSAQPLSQLFLRSWLRCAHRKGDITAARLGCRDTYAVGTPLTSPLTLVSTPARDIQESRVGPPQRHCKHRAEERPLCGERQHGPNDQRLWHRAAHSQREMRGARRPLNSGRVERRCIWTVSTRWSWR